MQIRHALATQAKDLAVLGTLRDGQPDRAIERGHGRGATEDSRIQVDRHGDKQIGSLALELRVGCDVHAQVQITLFSATGARRPLSGNTDPRAGARAGWDLDAQAAAIHVERARGTCVCFAQADLHRLLQILATTRLGLVLEPARLRGTRATKHLGEKVGKWGTAAKEVLQVLRGAVAHVHALAAWTSPRCLPAIPVKVAGLAAGLPIALPLGAKAVVLFPLLWIGEDLVGLIDLFEALLRFAIARVDVGMVLARQPPKRAADLFGFCVSAHAERLVVVFILHPVSTSLY